MGGGKVRPSLVAGGWKWRAYAMFGCRRLLGHKGQGRQNESFTFPQFNLTGKKKWKMEMKSIGVKKRVKEILILYISFQFENIKYTWLICFLG